jgi:hypothetical protein
MTMVGAYEEQDKREKRQWVILNVLNKESWPYDGFTSILLIQRNDKLFNGVPLMYRYSALCDRHRRRDRMDKGTNPNV